MNPFSNESISMALQQATAQKMVPEGKKGVLAVAAVVENGQPVVKATFATKMGDHWELGQSFEWHHDGDLGAGVQIVGSW